jgi:outer membrane protein assembly factor BamB
VRNHLLIFLFVFLGGCAAMPDNTAENTQSALVVEPHWVNEIPDVQGQLLRMTPVLQDRSLYVATEDGFLQKIAVEDGRVEWAETIDHNINTSGGEFEQLLIFGGDAEVIAVDVSNGELVWVSEVSSEVLAEPVIEDGIVVVRTVDGKLYGLDVHNGQQLWDFHWTVPTLSLRGDSRPAIKYGAVFIGTPAGRVVAVDLKTGKLYWDSIVAIARGRGELERMIDVDTAILVQDGIVFVSAFNQGIIALSAETGHVIWRRDINSMADFTLHGENLLVADSDGVLWSLSTKNGATFWKQERYRDYGFNGLSVHNNFLVARRNDSHLVWLNADEGKVITEIDLKRWYDYFPTKDQFYDYFEPFVEPKALLASTLVLNDQLFALDQRGVLHAFELNSSEIKQQ